MKWIRFGLVPVLVLTLASAALADDKTEAKTEAKPAAAKHGDWNKSPEQASKDALAKWQGTLKLTDEQKPKFESIMKDSYQKMADARKDAAGDRTKMKTSMQQIMAERDESLAKLLTPDQMKTYQAEMEKKKAEAKKKWDKDAKADTRDSAKEEKK
jgi:Spy/CpxP family protein refolding chaperone